MSLPLPIVLAIFPYQALCEAWHITGMSKTVSALERLREKTVKKVSWVQCQQYLKSAAGASGEGSGDQTGVTEAKPGGSHSAWARPR